MKEKYELWKAAMEEITSITKKEYCMTITIGLLAGIVLGILLSPRKYVVLGSFNGNHGPTDKECECDGEEEVKSCDWNS